jgi:threonine aldolase
MRFVGAQFVPYLKLGIWKETATHANRMAKILETEVRKLKGVQITQNVDANGIFAIVPKELIPQMQQAYFFYPWDEMRGEVRWMTSFDTTEEDIMDFVGVIRRLLGE